MTITIDYDYNYDYNYDYCLITVHYSLITVHLLPFAYSRIIKRMSKIPE